MTAVRLASVERTDGRTARRAASKERILAAAAELFAERGYGSTTMDEVAEAAGVSKGTIFYNYATKAELCTSVIQVAAEDIADDMASAGEGLVGWEALQAMALSAMRRIDAQPALAQFLMTELFRTHRPWAAELPAVRDRLIAPLIKTVMEVAEERRAAGLMKHADAYPGNVTSVAVSLLGALVTATLDHRAFPGRTLEEVHSGLQAAISGVRPPTP